MNLADAALDVANRVRTVNLPEDAEDPVVRKFDINARSFMGIVFTSTLPPQRAKDIWKTGCRCSSPRWWTWRRFPLRRTHPGDPGGARPGGPGESGPEHPPGHQHPEERGNYSSPSGRISSATRNPSCGSWGNPSRSASWRNSRFPEEFPVGWRTSPPSPTERRSCAGSPGTWERTPLS